MILFILQSILLGCFTFFSAVFLDKITGNVAGEALLTSILLPGQHSYNGSLPGLIWDTSNDGIRRPFLIVRPQKKSLRWGIYFTGKDGDLGLSLDFLKFLALHTKMNYLGVEYPGYGISKEATSFPAVNAVSDHAWNLLMKKGVDPLNIFLTGISIGTGAACDLAGRIANRGQRLGGLVLIAPYSSLYALTSSWSGGTGSFFIKNYWQCDKTLADPRATFPLLIIHGKRDWVIPVRQGKYLFKVAVSKEKELDLHNGGHQTIDVARWFTFLKNH